MNPQVNKQFAEIRSQLESDFRELGIDSEHVESLEEDGDDAEASPGVVGGEDAVNPTDIVASFESYIGHIADALLDEYEMSDDDALDIIFDLADEMAEDGDLPELPEDDDEQALAVWMGKAASIAFGPTVMATVAEWSEE